MLTLMLLTLAPARAGTLYGIDDIGGGNYNWFAFDTGTNTRSVLAPYTGPLDPARPGDLDWSTSSDQMFFNPGPPFFHDLYLINPRTAATTHAASYSPDIDTISFIYGGDVLAGFNLGQAGAPYYLFNYTTLNFDPLAPFPMPGTQGAEMVSCCEALTIEPSTGDVYELDINSGALTAVGNLGLTLPGVRTITYDEVTGQVFVLATNGRLYELDPLRTYAASLVYLALGDVVALDLVPRPTGLSPSVVNLGSCPGAAHLWVRDMTPGATVALLTANAAGLTSVPSGPCAGTLLPVAAPRLVATPRANALGEVTLTPTLPASVCGKKLMAVDLATCAITNVFTL